MRRWRRGRARAAARRPRPRLARRRRSAADRRRRGLRHQHRLRLARRRADRRRARWRRSSVNLLRSHAAGVGEPLPASTVRAMMALRANVLAKGYSGIRLETLDAPDRAAQRRRAPARAARGSVGASGDLAPLAHLALVLIGEGDASRDAGSVVSGRATALMRARRDSTPIDARPPRKASRSSTARRRPRPCSRWRWLARASAGARRRRRRGAVARRAARLDPSVRRAHPRAAAVRRASSPRRPICCALLDGQRASTSRTPTAARCRTPTRCAARRRCTAPRATRWPSSAGVVETEANAATDNPMVFADDRRHRLGRQLPRRAGGARGRPLAHWRSRSSPRSASGASIG